MMESAIPKSVQQQAEQADNLYQERYGNPAEPAPAVHDDPTPAPDGDLPPESQGNDTPTDEPKAQPVQDKTETASYWRHRFDVIQGKYDREVPALHQQVRDLTAEVDSLKASTQAGNEQRERLTDLTDDEIAAFSSEEINAIKKIAQQHGMASTEEVESLRQMVSELKQDSDRQKQESEDDAKATFWSKLEGAHPDVVAINATDEFRHFLAGTNPATGNQRNEDLKAAQARHDYTTVIEIFDAFKSQRPATQQQREVPEEHIEQPTARGGGDNLPAPSNTYTREWIRQFYKDKAMGYYKGKEEEASRIEADIFEAQGSGRVIG